MGYAKCMLMRMFSRLSLPLAVAVFFTVPLNRASALTFEELQLATGVLATREPNGTLTAMERESVVAFLNFRQGLLTTTANGLMLSRGKDADPIYKPAQWMSDSRRCSASILDFIIRHKPENANPGKPVDPNALMLAWFLCNCANSDSGAKMNAVVLLNKAFGAGYRGGDELARQIEKDVIQETRKSPPLQK